MRTNSSLLDSFSQEQQNQVHGAISRVWWTTRWEKLFLRVFRSLGCSPGSGFNFPNVRSSGENRHPNPRSNTAVEVATTGNRPQRSATFCGANLCFHQEAGGENGTRTHGTVSRT